MNTIEAAEYLRIERAAEWKHEFDADSIVEVPHPNRWHLLIAGNVAGTLSSQLGDCSVEAYISQMRVKVPTVPFYTYPDIVVSSHPTFEDDVTDTLLTPDVIVEIYSDSTEAYDRGRKFTHYRKLESLREYLLVAQDHCHVEHYARQDDHGWLLAETDSLDGRIELPTIDCTLLMSDAYRKVSLESSE